MEYLEQNYNTDLFFEEQAHSSSKGSPERNLLTAVLQRAIADLHDKSPKVREDAHYWFTSKNHKEQWGTCNHICEVIEMEPILLREALFRICEEEEESSVATTVTNSNGKISRKAGKLSRRAA